MRKWDTSDEWIEIREGNFRNHELGREREWNSDDTRCVACLCHNYCIIIKTLRHWEIKELWGQVMKPLYLNNIGSLFLNVIHIYSSRPNAWLWISLKGYFKGTKLFSGIFFCPSKCRKPAYSPSNRGVFPNYKTLDVWRLLFFLHRKGQAQAFCMAFKNKKVTPSLNTYFWYLVSFQNMLVVMFGFYIH